MSQISGVLVVPGHARITTWWLALAACTAPPARSGPEVEAPPPHPPVAADTDAPPVDDPLNRAPRVVAIDDLRLAEDAPPVRVPLFLSDDLTPPDDLEVTVTVDDPTLLDATRTVLTPGQLLQVALVPDAFGTGTVTVRVSDGERSSSTSFNVVVQPIDDPPTLALEPSYAMDEDGTGLTIVVDVQDIDTPLGDLRVTATAQDPTLFRAPGVEAVFDGTRWVIPLEPAIEASGSTRMDVTVTDAGTTLVRSSLLVVRAVPDPPVITGPALVSFDEDTTARVTYFLQDVDNGTESLRLTLVERGEATFGPRGVGLERGAIDHVVLVLNPLPDAHGTELIVLEVTDPGGPVVRTELVVEVVPVLDPPRPRTDDIGITPGHTTVEGGGLTANDGWVDGDALVVVEETVPSVAGGQVTLRADGSYTYVPPLGFLGVDSFSYRLAWDGPPAVGKANVRVAAPLTWYVDRSAPPGGDGRQAHPFADLAAWRASALVGPGDATVVLNTPGPDAAYDHLELQPGMTLVGRPADDPPTLAATSGDTLVLADDVIVAHLDIGGKERGIVGPGFLPKGAQLLDITLHSDGTAIDYAGHGTDTLLLDDVTIVAGGGVSFRGPGLLAGEASITSRDRAALRVEGGTLDLHLGLLASTAAATAGASVHADGGQLTVDRVSLTAVEGPALDMSGAVLSLVDPRGELACERGPILLLDVPSASLSLSRWLGGGGDAPVVDVAVQQPSSLVLDAHGDAPAPSKVRGAVRLDSANLTVTLRDLDVVQPGRAPALLLSALDRATLQDVTLDAAEVGLRVQGVPRVTATRLDARATGVAVDLPLQNGGSVELRDVDLTAGPSYDAAALRVWRPETATASASVALLGNVTLTTTGADSTAVDLQVDGTGATSVRLERPLVQRGGAGIEIDHAGAGDLFVDLDRPNVRPAPQRALGLAGEGVGYVAVRITGGQLESAGADAVVETHTLQADRQHLALSSTLLSDASGRHAVALRADGAGDVFVELLGVTAKVPGVGFDLSAGGFVRGCANLSGNTATWGGGGGYALSADDDAGWSLDGWSSSAAQTLTSRGNRGTVVTAGPIGPASTPCPSLLAPN